MICKLSSSSQDSSVAHFFNESYRLRGDRCFKSPADSHNLSAYAMRCDTSHRAARKVIQMTAVELYCLAHDEKYGLPFKLTEEISN